MSSSLSSNGTESIHPAPAGHEIPSTHKMKSNSSSERARTEELEQDEEEDAFGEFVYHGKDSLDAEEVVDEVEGHRSDEDGVSSAGTPTRDAGRLGNGHAKRHGQQASMPPSPLHSNDTFPGAITPSHSIPELLASAAFPRRPAAHPQISRLRSASTQLRRFPSSSSQSTFFDQQQQRPTDSPGSVGFDLVSRTSSVSNIHELANGFDLASSVNSSPAPASSVGRSAAKTFRWSSLRRVSSKMYPPIPRGGGITVIGTGASQAAMLGVPTVMAVSGIIAVGTSKGWVMVFDFSQNLQAICGTEAIAKEYGPVTAVAISQDHTFIAVGHAAGAIYLYAIVKPTQPARSVLPTTLQLVLTGRKEGHLLGQRILHLGFVGARHTAIVSSDETGLAFYHSLGKVLMLASTDIIRMLGRYPDPSAPLPRLAGAETNGTPSKSKKPSTILDMAPLPLGPAPHSSDSHSLVALMTPTKLVVVGLKPAPRTWWRTTPKDETELVGEEYSRNAVLAWYPSVAIEGTGGVTGIEVEGADPLLAFAWGRRVRLVKAGSARTAVNDSEKTTPPALDVEFVDLEGWVCDAPVLGLQWFNQRVLFTLTAHHIDVYDIQTRERIGRDTHDIRNVVSHDYYSSAFAGSREPSQTLSYSASFRAYKRKLFVLTLSDLQAGAVLSWADRILALMKPGSILEAIEVTTAYLNGQVDASTIILPDDPASRRDLVDPKLREILSASLDFVFSEERLRDGSHNDGASMQRLFEGLVGTCVRACLATGDTDWLFDELYERYERNGIESIFLGRIESFVLAGSVHALPPSVSQRLIAIHEERDEYEAAQRIIWHVDPEYLDIDQALGLCERQRLYDALIYVYTRSMHDFSAPIVKLLALVQRIQRHRAARPRRVGDDNLAGDAIGTKADMDVESTVPDAYKVYAYLSLALSGLSYPSKDPLPYEEAVLARNAVYDFVFSRRNVYWPELGGAVILTTDTGGDAEPKYPYLHLLLRFDAEAMLDALDLAFEDPYLEDDVAGKSYNRQRIVDILLQVIGPDCVDFTTSDRTFLHIFIARNIPKYPQYIELDPSILHRILVGLTTDLDQSTTDDRQLAAEYLLSSYTPHDGDAMIVLFEQASFFRILRSIYRGERRWAALASTYLRDPDLGADVFEFLRETFKLASRSTDAQRQELATIILDAVPSLVESDETGLQQTADLVDTFLPSYHSEVIERLASTPFRQFAYLRFLLEPASSDTDFSSASKDRTPSPHLDTSQQLLYLSLLAKNEPYHVIRYLEGDERSLAEEVEASRICEQAEVYDALIWMMDQRGETLGAMRRVDSVLQSRTDLLVKTFLEGDAEEGVDDSFDDSTSYIDDSKPADELLEQISRINKVAIQICTRRSSGSDRTESMSSEDIWYRLLSALITTVQTIRSLSPPHRRSSSASILHLTPSLFSPHASTLLASLIPNALSALVSTTSTQTISFPALMRRLISSPSDDSTIAPNRSYGEFKAIVTSMLKTFEFEQDLIAITSDIISQDLFEDVERLKEGKERGWKVGGSLCEECGQGVFTGDGAGGEVMSRSESASRVVEGLGMTGTPRLNKRPSLKGKEVDRVEGVRVAEEVVYDRPKGVVVGRDGRVWHLRCHLEQSAGGRRD